MNLYFLMCTVVIFISRFIKADVVFSFLLLEPHREKTGFLPMRKQRRRSASR